MLAVFLSQLRDSSEIREPSRLALDPSLCVPTLTTKNVNFRVLERHGFWLIWFGGKASCSVIRTCKVKIGKIYGLKILNKKEKKEKLLKKAQTPT